MFDIGFSEIALIAVVALIVLGPERLPRVARMAGRMMGQLQRYVHSVKSEIDREIQLEELKKLQGELNSAANKFESSLREGVQAVESEAKAVETEVQASSAEWAASSTPAVEAPLPEPAPETACAPQTDYLAGLLPRRPLEDDPR
ncbi:Sec-independent protein translocase protein TatB [Burkholderiales bacterium]|nr:MAG: twin-arginine translocase subunit TatB [Burkholderiales bacterium]CAG0955681.1 Sec-independent protein translocase protein TatB [Burkholderiales bacterium]